MLPSAHPKVHRLQVPLTALASGRTRYRLLTSEDRADLLGPHDTLAAAEPLVEGGGALAVFGLRHPEVAANAWRSEALGRFGARRSPAPPLDESLLLESAFDVLERQLELGIVPPRDLSIVGPGGGAVRRGVCVHVVRPGPPRKTYPNPGPPPTIK